MPKEYKIITIVALVALLGVSCIVAMGAWGELNATRWIGCSHGGYIEQDSIKDSFPLWATLMITPVLLFTIWWALPIYLVGLSLMVFGWLVLIYIAYRPCIVPRQGVGSSKNKRRIKVWNGFLSKLKDIRT